MPEAGPSSAARRRSRTLVSGPSKIARIRVLHQALGHQVDAAVVRWDRPP